MIKWAALIPFCALPMAAVQPKLTNIRLDHVTHTGVRVLWTADTKGVAQIKFGTASGNYQYRSYNLKPDQMSGAIAINALKPSTTYYLRIAFRPNAGNDVDICQTDECGSTEQSFTTLPEPATHPELPELPKTFKTDPPDTSGYVIQTVKQLPDGSCNIQQLLDAANYGTVIELPQGMTCKVFPIKANDSRGYSLRGKPLDPSAGGNIDSPNHRWIVIRTAKGPATLTPPGVRVTPQTAAAFAKLEAQKPIGTGGEVFSSDHRGMGSHHYRIETLELTHTNSPAVFPPDGADPEPVRSLIALWGHVIPSIPTHIICDRLYIHGRGFPARLKFGIWLNGKYVALTNSYIDKVDFWRPYKWPDAPPLLSPDRRMISVPAKSFQRNRNETPWTMTQPATVGLSADINFKGTFSGFLGPNGVVIEHKDANPAAQAQATLYCVNCTSVRKAAADPLFTGYYWFGGTIAGGQFTITNTLYKAYIRIGATVEPNYKFTNNVIIGGVKGGSKAALTDVDGKDMMGYISRLGSTDGLASPRGRSRA